MIYYFGIPSHTQSMVAYKVWLIVSGKPVECCIVDVVNSSAGIYGLSFGLICVSSVTNKYTNKFCRSLQTPARLQAAHGSVWQCMAAPNLLLLFSINAMQSCKIVFFVIHICLVNHSICHCRSTVGSIYSKVQAYKSELDAERWWSWAVRWWNWFSCSSELRRYSKVVFPE